MTLTKLNAGELTQNKKVPGLLDCQIDYEVKSGKGRLDYVGPKIPPEMWHQVLSFFRWTYKEMQSESQVRLYVNLKLGRWAAWAFPQEARTGMSAHEIPAAESVEQARERFAFWGSEPSSDWLYFGTAHHHCSTLAFQSGTDEANERDQDGLHLTVGRIDQERHDVHARFYLAGNCFEPDMGAFWEISPDLASQIPSSMLDPVARHQMGNKVVMDFPDQWRKNVMELKKPPELFLTKVARSYPELTPWDWNSAEDAMTELNTNPLTSTMRDDELLTTLQALAEDPAICAIVETCIKHRITPMDLLMEEHPFSVS